MERAYLERIQPEKGMARFYTVAVWPTLWGEWAVVREWGRIGQGGTVRMTAFATETEASMEFVRALDRKQRRGYRRRT